MVLTKSLQMTEYMKVIYEIRGSRNEYESDHPSNEHYLSSRETKAWNNHDTRLFYSYPK